jgi:perosamine synthetase
MTFTLPSDQDASGRSFGPEELALVAEVLSSGTLTSTKGLQVNQFQAEFAALLGVKHAIACSSGSAAIHVAIAAVDPQPGDEIITTSITDMGALTPILYQGAIPVFADVDPTTGNVTRASVEAVVSPRTKAIVVTHLFGNPADVAGIVAWAAERNIAVIEDTAQAPLARQQGTFVGTIGNLGCFSLQQGKHITTGEGGVVVTNDDALARRCRLFVNKAWPYGESNPDHEFIALNYRYTEVQGAVARGQLAKLPALVAHRIAMADRLRKLLDGTPGLLIPGPLAGDTHVWWRFPLRVDLSVLPGGPVALAAQLREVDIASAPRYIVKPAFKCKVIAEQRTFGDSRWPFTLARPEAVRYDDADFTGTYAYLESVLVLPWSEKMTPDLVDGLAARVVSAAGALVASS